MPHHRPLAATPALIVLADLLFWGHAPGLSLAVFALALFAAALRERPRPLALATLGLAVLPVIDYVQTLSLAILALGLLAALSLQARAGQASARQMLALLGQVPTRALTDLARGLGGARPVLSPRAFWRNWALPLGGGLVLMSLLAEANPVLNGWLQQLANLPFDPSAWLRRMMFWAGTGLISWPLILSDAAPTPPRQGPRRPADLGQWGLTPQSVARALVLFNAALALQSLMDARYLWQSVTPPGLTLAAYAHRGAYPLLATALLAGAFSLAARPFAERPALRALLYLWLGQNILLTLSALYRLDLYIQSYGLTYLRIHAAIWMGLVAAGLTLTAWQIATRRSNAWLLLRSTVLGAATLYACAFINFADLIARTNLAMGKIDTLYLCQLGPTAAASVPGLLRVETFSYEGEGYCTLTPPVIEGWRDWGFRNWRVLHSLDRQEATP